MVLFGGKNSSGTAIQETWTWDGTTWTKLTPATQPPARWGTQLVYDTALAKMVLFIRAFVRCRQLGPRALAT